MDAVIRYGPAGWSYKDWEGLVYPRPSPRGFDPLAYLARYFDALEIDSTFYRPAAPKVAQAWVRRVAHNPRFRFTAKLFRRFTHERESAFTREEVKQVRAGLEVLRGAGRLGAVLLQFPWSFRRTDENRRWLRDVVGALEGLPLVLEVRHASWDVPEAYESLAERGVGIANIDQPLFHDSMRPGARATSPVGYVRVHGRNYHDWFRKDAGPNARYDYLYTAEQLAPWAARIRELASAGGMEELYVVMNNHFRGKAPANALMLQALVEGRPVEAPPPLVEAYPDVLAGLAYPSDQMESSRQPQ